MHEWNEYRAIWIGVFVNRPGPNASLCHHKCQCVCPNYYLLPVGKIMLISCRSWFMWFNTVLVALISAEANHRPREEKDLVSDTYTYTKDACMHSNTTSCAVSAFAPPHTIKVPIKGHYGFSTSSNHRREQLHGPYIAGTQMSPLLSSKGTQDSSTNFMIIITDQN